MLVRALLLALRTSAPLVALYVGRARGNVVHVGRESEDPGHEHDQPYLSARSAENAATIMRRGLSLARGGPLRDGEETIRARAVAHTTRAVLCHRTEPRLAILGAWFAPGDVTRVSC